MRLPKLLRGSDDVADTDEVKAKPAKRPRPAKSTPPAKDQAKSKPPKRPSRERAKPPAKAEAKDPARTGRANRETPPARRPERKRPAPARRAAAAGTQARRAGAALGGTLKEGAQETRGRTRAASPGAAKALLGLLGTLFAIFFGGLGFVLNVLVAVAGPVGRLLRTLRRGADALSRALTPRRTLALVVLGATVLLALSQYADYRGVSIGTDEYTAVETVAPAPEIDRQAAGEAHGYAFVPVAAVCALLLGGALRGRWQLCRLISLAGLAAIVVGLLIDRSSGLDPGNATQAFEGVKASLLGGFYAQLSAGFLLAISSLMLGRELRIAGAEASSGEATRPDPGKPRRPALPRRRARTEGAQA